MKSKKIVLCYSDLNWYQKILYKIRLKRYLKSKIDYKRLVGNTLLQEEVFKRKDKSYNDLIKEFFNA